MSGTFDFSTLHVILGGVHRVTGRAKGDSVSVVYDNDTYIKTVGVDGTGYFTKISDKSATITLTLGLDSISNAVLSALKLADDAAPGGLMFPLLIRDGAGSSAFFTTRARVMKLADGVWSDGGPNRVWTLGTISMEGFIGGLNATPLAPADLLAA